MSICLVWTSFNVLTSISDRTDATASMIFIFKSLNVFYFNLENVCLNIPPEKEIQGVMSGPASASGRHAESNGFEIHHPKPPLYVNLSVDGFRQVETIL